MTVLHFNLRKRFLLFTVGRFLTNKKDSGDSPLGKKYLIMGSNNDGTHDIEVGALAAQLSVPLKVKPVKESDANRKVLPALDLPFDGTKSYSIIFFLFFLHFILFSDTLASHLDVLHIIFSSASFFSVY